MNAYFKNFIELTPLELYRILQLRSEVFVVEQNCVYQDLDDRDIKSTHVLIWENDVLIATARVLPKKVSYDEYVSIGRVCTKKTSRGLGLGIQLMNECINLIHLKYPNERIKISAQMYLEKFYSEFGFVSIGEKYLEDNIPHIAMIKL